MHYVIRKVPERDTSILESILGNDVIVYSDEQHKGALNAFIDVLNRVNDDAVFIQDDMILCRNFKKRVSEYINSHKDEVVVFSNNDNDKECKDARHEGYYSSMIAGWQLCTYIPLKYAKGFLEWWFIKGGNKKVPKYYIQRQYDDFCFNRYLYEIGQPVFLVVPNLAGHPKNESTISKRSYRITHNFNYEDTDPLYGNVKDKKYENKIG